MVKEVTELLALLKDSGPAYLVLVVFLMLYLRAQRKIDRLQSKLLKLATSQVAVNARLEAAYSESRERRQREPAP